MWPLYRYRPEQWLRAMGDEAVERCSTWNSRDVAVVETPHMERWPLATDPPTPLHRPRVGRASSTKRS